MSDTNSAVVDDDGDLRNEPDLDVSVELYSIEEAAARLRISRSTLYKVVAAGEIDVVRMTPNGRPWISPEALRAFIAAHTVPARSGAVAAAAAS